MTALSGGSPRRAHSSLHNKTTPRAQAIRYETEHLGDPLSLAAVAPASLPIYSNS